MASASAVVADMMFGYGEAEVDAQLGQASAQLLWRKVDDYLFEGAVTIRYVFDIVIPGRKIEHVARIGLISNVAVMYQFLAPEHKTDGMS